MDCACARPTRSGKEFPDSSTVAEEGMALSLHSPCWLAPAWVTTCLNLPIQHQVHMQFPKNQWMQMQTNYHHHLQHLPAKLL